MTQSSLGISKSFPKGRKIYTKWQLTRGRRKEKEHYKIRNQYGQRPKPKGLKPIGGLSEAERGGRFGFGNVNSER